MTDPDPVAVLRAIIEEVAGATPPFSSDSYLPPHLVHDARMAIENHERGHVPDVAAWQAQEQILLARLQQADEMCNFLRHENADLSRRLYLYEQEQIGRKWQA